MEAGYDYTLLHPSGRRRRHGKAIGVFFIVLGVTLLVMTGAYYAYGATAYADLARLNTSLPQPDPAGSGTAANQDPSGMPKRELDMVAAQEQAGDSTPAKSVKEGTTPRTEAPTGNISETVASAGQSLTKDDGGSSAESRLDVMKAERIAAIPVFQPEAEAVAEGKRSVFEEMAAEPTAPKFWMDTSSYDAASPDLKALVESFTPIDADGAFTPGSRLASTRLSVPSAGIDAKVVELKVADLDGVRSYQTPDKTAGHIPETANAGEAGSAWFFGHTETPIMGEGSVFFNLVEIPKLIKEGRDVFATAESEESQYLYRLVSSQVVHEDDIRLYDSGGATIHLVSCVPRLVYDHRLIVSGELIGHNGLNGDT